MQLTIEMKQMKTTIVVVCVWTLDTPDIRILRHCRLALTSAVLFKSIDFVRRTPSILAARCRPNPSVTLNH